MKTTPVDFSMLMDKLADLRRELEESKAETAACLKFLECEYGWECFRADEFAADRLANPSSSERNAEKIKEYLRKTGHGLEFLKEYNRLKNLEVR